MQQTILIINQIGILGLIALLSYVSVKTGYISGDIKDHIGKLIVKITMPLLVIYSLSNANLSSQLIANGFVLVGMAYLCLGVMFCIAYGVSRLLRLKEQLLVVNTCISMFGNVIFLGYPLVKMVYGDEGLFYAVLFSISSDSLAYTLGIIKMSGGKGKASLKSLINPNTISFVIAILLLAFKIKLIEPIGSAVNLIGSATTPLSMVFIGSVLAGVSFKELYQKYSLFAVAAVKQLINPLAVIGIVMLMPISPIIKGVLVLQCSMPSQTMLSVLAKEYGSDYKYAAEGIFITTIVSIVTLPLVFYIFKIIVSV